MITIAVCSIAFRDEAITQLIPRFAAIGFDAVEIFGAHLDGMSDAQVGEVARIAADHGIGIVAVAPYLSFTREQERYAASLDTAKRFVHHARALGSRLFRTFTDVGPAGIGGTVATPAQWQQGIRGLQELTALDRELTFALETNERTLADSLDNIDRILREVSAPNLGVLYQPSSAFFHDAGIIPCWRRLRPHIVHMHLHNHDPETGEIWLESGALDMAGFLAAIRDEGYDRSVSLEYCCRGVDWQRVISGQRFLAAHLRSG